MKIAILGASGEIGTYITRHLLKDGQDVVPVVRNSLGPYLSRYKLQPTIIDFQSVSSLSKAIEGCDAVVNCTIDKGGRGGSANPTETNIHICQNIIRSCQANQKIKKIIHLSSIAVLPPRISKEVVQNPYKYSLEKDWYTISKIETEKIFLRASSKLPVTIIRPGIVYGANMSWSRGWFDKSKNAVIVLPDGNGLCNAVHPVDVSRLVCHILHAQNLTSLVYAAYPERLTWKQYYRGHGLNIKQDTISRIKFEHQLNRSKKEIISGLSTLFRHPVIGRPLHLKPAHQFGQRFINQHLFSTEIASQFVKKVYPSAFELELYLSNVQLGEIVDAGDSINFRYSINFRKGIYNASAWNNYQYEK